MNIYSFGDSISFGQGVSLERCWFTRIGETLRKKFPEYDTLLQNPSVNGNTTRMALERMPHDVQEHEVDILLIGFGMNDCNYWLTDRGLPRVSPSAFRENLKEIIDRAFHFGVKEVILRTNHPSPRTDLMTHTNITYGESNRYYNSMIREVAGERSRVIFTDIERIFEKIHRGGVFYEELTLPDKVHLSPAGHDLYYDSLYPVVETAVIKTAKAVE